MARGISASYEIQPEVRRINVLRFLSGMRLRNNPGRTWAYFHIGIGIVRCRDKYIDLE